MTSTPLYAPLRDQDTIRLLRLKPGNDGNGINVILELFSLSAEIEFNALSYVWGDLKPERWVSCNGHRVSITPNLHDALSQLLQKGFDGLLWVDALCINQKDNDEKSAQVSMMRDIFSRATKVIFWLGEQQPFDQDGARLMKNFFRDNPEPPLGAQSRYKTMGELRMPHDVIGWVGWASLLSRPWFGRVWIMQEFFSAKDSVFMSGAVEIPTEVLLHCAAATSTYMVLQDIFVVQTESVLTATTLAERLFSLYLAQSSGCFIEEEIDLYDLWKRSRLLEATDERDRVFALLSLQTTLPMDMIDYNKNLVELYTEVAEKVLTQPILLEPSEEPSRNLSEIETYRSSRFLAFKERSLSEPKLPSWVPDWRPSGIRFVPLTQYFRGLSFFSHPYQDAVIENGMMSISGILVDKPWAIVDSIPYMEDILSTFHREVVKTGLITDRWATAMLNWQYMCYVLARSKNGALPKRLVLAAFCRTMAFGALSGQDDATIAEYIGGLQVQREDISVTARQDDRHRAAFEGPESSDRRWSEFKTLFTELSPGRKFCVTQSGRLAWIPQAAMPDDEICYLAGCAVPFVIRRAGESWELLGDCYLDGSMVDRSPIFDQQPQIFKFI